MDVPSAAFSASIPTQAPPPAPLPAPAPAAPNASASNGATPVAAPQSSQASLSPFVAKLFNSHEQNVEVSFEVQSHEIVTVFTDKSTGKEIIQFPSKELIAFGEMLDKDAGKVLDKSA